MNIVTILFFILCGSVYFSLLIFNTNYMGRTVVCLMTERQNFFLIESTLSYAHAYYKQNRNAMQLPFNKRINLFQVWPSLSADIKMDRVVDDNIKIVAQVYLDNKFIGIKSKIIKQG